MKTNATRLTPSILTLAATLLAGVAQAAPVNTPGTPPAIEAGPAITYVRAPLSFEPNLGQAGPGVDYISRAGGGTLLLSPSEATVVMGAQPPESGTKPTSIAVPQSRALRLKLLGVNPHAKAVPADPLPGKVNYFLGKDAKQWRTNIPTYAKVTYKDVYPGVDLVYYGNQRQLEFDFLLSPGADPKQIALDFDGADKVELDAQRNLVVTAARGQLVQHKPIIYQMANGVRKEIPGAFKLGGKYQARFEVAAYDRSWPLVIDPVLTYSTYLGGSSADGANGVAVDGFGNFYITGGTHSTNFPTVAALQSENPPNACNPAADREAAFVAKFRPDGTLVYCTYLGGGECYGEYGNGIAVDGAGNAYVTGEAGGPFFPTTPGAFQRMGELGNSFVAKLSADGSQLIYSTYLGGTGAPASYGYGFGIALDSSGAAYVCGSTTANNLPVTANAFQRTYGGTGIHGVTGYNYMGDGFVAKIDPSGSNLVYATYLGGAGDDVATDIAVDSFGQAYVTGVTFSTNFPHSTTAYQTYLNGRSDAFVVKLNADGSALEYSTFLGGSSDENFDNINYDRRGIAIDSAGCAYVSGETKSPDFPTTINAVQPAPSAGGFATKLSPDGSSLVYSTYLTGCRANGWPHGIAVDGAGNAYLTGQAGCCSPSDLPSVNALFADQQGYGAFVSKISADGSKLLYSTFLFGSDRGLDGKAIAVDSSGNAYVAGSTEATDFPITANAIQPSFAGSGSGSGDAFVAVIHSDNEPPPPVPVALIYGDGLADGSVWSAAAASGQCSAYFPHAIMVSNATQCVDIMTYTQTPDPAGGGTVHHANHIGGCNPLVTCFSLTTSFSVGTNFIYGLVHDITGATSTFTIVFVVLDNQPPTVSCSANIVANAPCGASGLAVSYPAPVADSDCPGVTVTCNPPSGSIFPIGTTTVNCTARNASGDTATCSFTVTVNATLYQFTGFLSPIGGADATGGSFSSPLRTFKLNSTIPVKFTAACSGSPVTTGIQTLEVIKYTNATTAGTPIDATPTDAATTGDQFRLTDASAGQWQFNLDARATGMSTGIWLFQATLSDGSQHTAWIQIK